MTWLAKLRVGKGTLAPELRAEFESEGLVHIEEGLRGSVRYKRFKAPGRRHHGKVTPERLALVITEERLAIYCRSGTTKLVDSSFSDSRLSNLDVSLENNDAVAIRIDFDRADIPKVSGEITILARTPNAPMIVEELQRRLAR